MRKKPMKNRVDVGSGIVCEARSQRELIVQLTALARRLVSVCSQEPRIYRDPEDADMVYVLHVDECGWYSYRTTPLGLRSAVQRPQFAYTGYSSSDIIKVDLQLRSHLAQLAWMHEPPAVRDADTAAWRRYITPDDGPAYTEMRAWIVAVKAATTQEKK